MRNALSNRLAAAILPAAIVVTYASCSETKDVNPQESAPVGSAQPTATRTTGAVPEPGKVATTALSEAGVDLAKLPVPEGAAPFYADPNGAMFRTAAAVEPTAKEVSRLLQAEGWSPYGSVEGTQDFKRNLVRLKASVGPISGEGKTMITYSAEKIAVDLPARTDAEGLQYSDSTKQVLYDTKADMSEVEKYYRELLGKSEWKATTDKPFKSGFKDELIFRNPKKDMLTLQMHEFEGKRRVTLKHMSAAEVAEQEARMQAELDQKKRDAEKPLPKLKLTAPVGAMNVEQTKHRLKFEVATGKAKGIVESWRKELTSSGWKEEDVKVTDIFGGVTFRKEKQFLSLDYIESGVTPGEIILTATGAELEPWTR